MEEKKKKYFLLYLKTGGGHLAPAKAVFNFINKYYSASSQPELIYGFEKSPDWIKYTIEDGYRILQAEAKWFFEFLYAVNKINVIARITSLLVSYFVIDYLEEIIIKEKPDKIIVFHFFLLHPVFKILKKNNLIIPVTTVVTDPFTPHPMWFLRKKQNFVLFSEKLASRIRNKLPHSSIKVFSFILNEKFSSPMSSEKIIHSKQNLDYNVDKKVLLVLGGGDGIPHGKEISKELLNANMNVQIAIVCGKNDLLLNEVNKLKIDYPSAGLKVYGYVDFIYELLNISDVIITKCGASTIMEILILQKVPIVNDYLWEQEQGNIDYIKEKVLGIYEPKIKKIPSAANDLLNDKETYSKYRNNIINEKIRNGLKEFVEFILS
jgi:processive 1,2-diacylglycerol beta-glucosyltransferase/1,2-diacylglycerol 3-beta-galactosyltransferase